MLKAWLIDLKKDTRTCLWEREPRMDHSHTWHYISEIKLVISMVVHLPERRGKNGSGVVLLFASTKALSSCLLGRPLSRWSAAAHPSSGESSKFEPDVIIQGSFLLAFGLPLDSSGDKSMKSFKITWQLLRIISLFDRQREEDALYQDKRF